MPSIISFIGQTSQTTTNSFSTIQPPSGTSPTASSPTDTLTLTSTDGTVAIIGDSATDTIDFSVVSAPLAATYVTLTANATLPNERILTGTANQIIIADNGAGSSVVLSTPQNIHTGATPTFSGLTLSSFTLGSVIFADTGGLLSQDNATFFWDNTNKGLAIGNNTVTQSFGGANQTSKFIVETSGTSDVVDVFFHRHSSTASISTKAGFGRTRGTAGSPTIVSLGDAIGSQSFYGWDGSTFRPAARIEGNVDSSGTVSTSSMPGNLKFFVTPTGSVTPALALTIDNTKLATFAAGVTISGLTTAGPVITTSGGSLSSEATLAVSRGGTNIGSYITGDMLYASGSTTLSKLAIGGAATILASTGTAPQWQSLSTAGIAPSNASYVTVSAESGLPSERVLTGTSGQITIIDGGSNTTVTLALASLVTNLSVQDSTFAIKDDGDNTKIAKFQISSIATGTTRTFTTPNNDGTIVAYATPAAGDIPYANAATTFTKLSIGTSGNVLTSSGTAPQWQSLASAGIAPNNLTYITVNNETGTLANSSRISFNTTNFSTTNIANVYSVNTIQDISTTSSPQFSTTTVQRIIISGSTNNNFINANGTLDNATGDETAYSLQYSVSKATSGNTTGLLVAGLFTSPAPGSTNYLLDLQNAGTSRFSIDSAGQLITSATTWTLTTITSFTMQDVLLRPLLFADATSFKIKTNPVYLEMAASSSGIPAPSMTTTVPANTGITAASEYVSLLIDMSATQSWSAGTVANNRSLKILAPTLSASVASVFTEVSTIYISGPPAVSTANCTTSIGFKLDQRTLSANVLTGIGFQVYAPTGAGTNSCGSFMGGNVGVNSISPDCWLDIKVTDITSTNQSVVCIDGTTRYVGCYMGGTAIPVAPASNTSVLCLDFGWAPTADSAFNVACNQMIFTLQGAVNTTAAVRGLFNQLIIDSTGGTATQTNANTSVLQTTANSAGNITTGRCNQSTINISGTGTLSTLVLYDTSITYNNVAGSATNTYGVRINNISKGAAYTLTNFYGVRVEDQTATFGGVKVAYYAAGTNTHNRFANSTSFGQDATPGATVDVGGKLWFDGSTGTTTKYNNQTTAGTGVPYLLQAPAISATKTANFTVFSYTPAAAAGVYKVYACITTTSATNTGTVQITLDYVDSQGTTHTADIIPLVDAAGAVATTKSGASKEFHTIPWLFTINNSATAIALKVVITGTVSYTVAGTIERVI